MLRMWRAPLVTDGEKRRWRSVRQAYRASVGNRQVGPQWVTHNLVTRRQDARRVRGIPPLLRACHLYPI